MFIRVESPDEAVVVVLVDRDSIGGGEAGLGSGMALGSAVEEDQGEKQVGEAVKAWGGGEEDDDDWVTGGVVVVVEVAIADVIDIPTSRRVSSLPEVGDFSVRTTKS